MAAYGNGQMNVYDSSTGKLGATVSAHARWINALDVAKETGLVCVDMEKIFIFFYLLIPYSCFLYDLHYFLY